MNRRHWIIDGYNVIHSIPSLEKTLAHNAATAREEFIHRCATFALAENVRCSIIFDGAAEHRHPASSIPAPVHVVFSHPHSADDVIRATIDRAKHRSTLVIISSDTKIIQYARTCSCETHSSRHFSNLLSSMKEDSVEKSETPLTPAQIREWLKIFGE